MEKLYVWKNSLYNLLKKYYDYSISPKQFILENGEENSNLRKIAERTALRENGM